MDYIINLSKEENPSTRHINNDKEQNNKAINPEGFNLLDNEFLSNQKHIALFKLIDKQANEEKENKNIINYDKDIFNLDEKISKNINEIIKVSSKINALKKEESEKPKRKCGRKRKNKENKKEHDKFSDDNIRRKCKHLVLQNVMNFINEKIYNMYEGKIGNGIFRKELKTLNHNQKKDTTVVFDQNFLYKNLGEIFSDNISCRYTNIPLIHNKRLISALINEKDEIKKKYFVDLFNIIFLDCLKHFRGEIFVKELEGLNRFENLKEIIKNKYKEEEGDDYVESLEYYLNNYESIVGAKKPRAKRIDK